MFVAKVTGSLVSTQKVATMVGYKLMIVEPYRLEPNERKSLMTTGRTFVAVDLLGAGEGDLVLITQGSSARLTAETKNMPLDTVIVGIVDQMHVDSTCVYSRAHDGDGTDNAATYRGGKDNEHNGEDEAGR